MIKWSSILSLSYLVLCLLERADCFMMFFLSKFILFSCFFHYSHVPTLGLTSLSCYNIFLFPLLIRFISFLLNIPLSVPFIWLTFMYWTCGFVRSPREILDPAESKFVLLARIAWCCSDPRWNDVELRTLTGSPSVSAFYYSFK